MNFFKRKQKNNIGAQVVDTELSKLIDERSLVFNQKHIQETVQKLSVLKFQQMSDSTNISQFLGELCMDFQSLVERINQRCNMNLQKTRGKASIDNSNEKEQDLLEQINEVDHKLSNVKATFKNTGKQYKAEINMWYMIRLFLIFIAAAELAGNYDVFSSIGGGLISNIGISLLSAICIYFYAHFTPEKVDSYAKNNARKQLLYYILYFIPIIVVFYGFSVLRINYINALSPNAQFNTNPIIIVSINAFAYAISYWLVKRYKPSKDKILSYKKYKQDAKSIKELERQKRELIEQQKAIAPELREELGDRLSIMLLGEMLENEVVSRYKSCYNAFKLELFVKTSGACEILFTGNLDVDLPKLQLYYQDVNENYN